MGVGGSCECQREHAESPRLDDEEPEMVADKSPDAVADRRGAEEGATSESGAPAEEMSAERVDQVLKSASQGSIELAEVIKSNPKVLDRNPALAARVEMLNARLAKVKTAVEQKKEGGWFQGGQRSAEHATGH